MRNMIKPSNDNLENMVVYKKQDLCGRNKLIPFYHYSNKAWNRDKNEIEDEYNELGLQLRDEIMYLLEVSNEIAKKELSTGNIMSVYLLPLIGKKAAKWLVFIDKEYEESSDKLDWEIVMVIANPTKPFVDRILSDIECTDCTFPQISMF